MDIICLAQFRQNVKYKHGQVDTLRNWILIIRSQFCPSSVHLSGFGRIEIEPNMT